MKSRQAVQDDMPDGSNDLFSDDMDPVTIKPDPVLNVQKIEPISIPKLKPKSETPAKTARTGNSEDDLEPSKTVTREEADAAKVQRIKSMTQDLDMPATSKKTALPAKDQPPSVATPAKRAATQEPRVTSMEVEEITRKDNEDKVKKRISEVERQLEVNNAALRQIEQKKQAAAKAVK